MPWKQTDPMLERVEFIATYRSGHYSMTELCDRFEVSRPTAYKWVERFEAEGIDGLKERSRAPHTSPHRTPDAVVDLVVETREKHIDWGPITIIDYLRPRHPQYRMPAASTAGEILKRAGLLEPKPPKKRSTHAGSPSMETSAPNQIWSADYKGEFRLCNGRYCYPLTISDGHSRLLLGCQGLYSTELSLAWPVFERVFDNFGIPESIRTDNGSPFASTGLGGLSRLNVWWTKLGIIHQRIKPGRPQQNGRHERMHRTLKAAVTRPREFDLAAQQVRLDAFTEEYNNIRPHRALGGVTPASAYQRSSRSMPDRLAAPDYPGHWEIRRVSGRGRVKFKGNLIFLSTALVSENVAFDEIEDGLWSVFYYDKLLARFDEQTKTLI